MNPTVRARLEVLRAHYEKLPIAEMLEFKWKDLEIEELHGRRYLPSVWAESRDGRVLLVVQMQRTTIIPFIKETLCIGSLVSENGAIEHVDENYLMNEVGHP